MGAADGDGAGKALLRRVALAARAALPVEARASGDRARDLLLAPLLAGRRVATYEAFGTEPVAPLPPAALVPVLRPDRDLDWRVTGTPDLLGPQAVAGCDVLLVPALAADRRGVRLGRGGGSYDRALARATGLVVALLHDGELAASLPTEAHDIGVHLLALPSGLVRTSRPAPSGGLLESSP